MENIQISSQEIYEKLLNEDKLKSANPYEINRAISDYQYKFQENRDNIIPEDFFKELNEVSENETFLEELMVNNYNDSEEEIEVLDSLDNLANNLFGQKKVNFISCRIRKHLSSPHPVPRVRCLSASRTVSS